jgi:hypothetical protein
MILRQRGNVRGTDNSVSPRERGRPARFEKHFGKRADTRTKLVTDLLAELTPDFATINLHA